ncbi:hypothetical protein P4123_25415 [Pseudomonas aeruginosa]|nr:hypothetical protein [Pseudomonas aeruginosa]
MAIHVHEGLAEADFAKCIEFGLAQTVGLRAVASDRRTASPVLPPADFQGIWSTCLLDRTEQFHAFMFQQAMHHCRVGQAQQHRLAMGRLDAQKVPQVLRQDRQADPGEEQVAPFLCGVVEERLQDRVLAAIEGDQAGRQVQQFLPAAVAVQRLEGRSIAPLVELARQFRDADAIEQQVGIQRPGQVGGQGG